MKNIVGLILIIFFSLTAQSQTVDNNFTAAIAVKITPFKVNYLDSVNVDHFALIVSYDDLVTQCGVHYTFYDSTGYNRLEGNILFTGAVYKSWNHTFSQAYALVGNKLKITFQ